MSTERIWHKGPPPHQSRGAVMSPASRDISELEDSVLIALESAQAKAKELSEAVKVLREHIGRALGILVKVGDIIDRHSFGAVYVVRGADRGARRFEVASKATPHEINTTHPELSNFLVEAWPLNDAGKRMSGRTGVRASSTIVLKVDLCSFALDDPASGNEILMRVVARAAIAGPAGGQS